MLTINIISRMPNDIGTLWQQFITGKTVPKAVLAAVIIVAIIVAMVLFVVLLQGGERYQSNRVNRLIRIAPVRLRHTL